MQRSTDRILTTHAGTLPRSPELAEAFNKRAEDPDRFAKLLTPAVAESVRQQAAAGVDVINDGELSKIVWSWYVMERLGGFEYRAGKLGEVLGGEDQTEFAEFYADAMKTGLWHGDTDANTLLAYGRTPVCTGPITYQPAQVEQDIANLTAALAGVEVADAVVPAVAPASVEVGQENEHYATQEEYLFALADALHEEYKAITDAGFLVQVDDAWTPALWNQQRPDIDLETFHRFCQPRVDALNHALRGIPEEKVRYHICWGSWHGPHKSDIPLRDVLPLMLQVNAGAYLFEAANVRHEHEYHVWEDVALPEGRVVIPGVVSHATNILEHPELVAERICRFADRVGRENVLAGTDCGLGGRVHPQLVWAKLASIAEGARIATERLWKR